MIDMILTTILGIIVIMLILISILSLVSIASKCIGLFINKFKSSKKMTIIEKVLNFIKNFTIIVGYLFLIFIVICIAYDFGHSILELF